MTNRLITYSQFDWETLKSLYREHTNSVKHELCIPKKKVKETRERKEGMIFRNPLNPSSPSKFMWTEEHP